MSVPVSILPLAFLAAFAGLLLAVEEITMAEDAAIPHALLLLALTP